MSRQDYIKEYKDIAIEKMNEFGIPASITLAQGILESGSGNSRLARRANNHFGIKCHKGWDGKTFRLDDDERRECFRKYKNPAESYRDHSYFLTTRGRYSDLFKLEVTDYKGWAKGLKKAGYATNPKYPQLLIKIIEQEKLYEFDKGRKIAKKTKDKPKGDKKRQVYTVGADQFELVKTGGNDRNVYSNNGVNFIIAEEGDEVHELAEEFEIYSWQIYKYNDLDKKDDLKPGQMIYLEKKKTKSKTAFHMVKENESMYTISQQYAIRLKNLYKRNKMEPGTEPEKGQRILLR